MKAIYRLCFVLLGSFMLLSCSDDTESLPCAGANECCELNKSCNSQREFCCSEDTILQCVGTRYEEYQDCTSPVGTCREGSRDCECNIGDVGCFDSTTEQRCQQGLGGAGQPQTYECAPATTCTDGVGCEVCVDQCIVGEYSCSANGNQVLECERLPPNNCAGFVPVRSCADSNMICVDSATSFNDPFQYCINECGGRGVALDHEVCDPAGTNEPPCAVYVCSGQTSLALDHTACLAGGIPCIRDDQCASCDCLGGVCQGNNPAHCPEADGCP